MKLKISLRPRTLYGKSIRNKSEKITKHQINFDRVKNCAGCAIVLVFQWENRIVAMREIGPTWLTSPLDHRTTFRKRKNHVLSCNDVSQQCDRDNNKRRSFHVERRTITFYRSPALYFALRSPFLVCFVDLTVKHILWKEGFDSIFAFFT